MARDASALGHLGLLFGLLAVVVELNQIVVESSPTPGDATAAFYLALILWVVGVAAVAVGWIRERRTA